MQSKRIILIAMVPMIFSMYHLQYGAGMLRRR